jgi:hypothetical protein
MAAPLWLWGQCAKEITLLNIYCVEPGKLPPMPLKLAEPTHIVDHRPIELALGLLEVARRVRA